MDSVSSTYFGRQTHSVKLKSACLKSLHCRPRWRTVGLTEFCTAGHQTLTHSPPFADVVRLPASQAVTSARRKFKKKTKKTKEKKTGSDPSLCSAIGNKRWIIFLIMGIVTGVFPAVNSLVCSPKCDLCFMCSGRNEGFSFFFLFFFLVNEIFIFTALVFNGTGKKKLQQKQTL